jgi:hypothetical protein
MKCPGQDRRYWTGNAVNEVPCPKCGHSVEIFKDENSGRCTHCGHRFLNPGTDFGCAQWCSLATECLGYTPQKKSDGNASESALAAQLIQWVEQEFKGNPTCIAHVLTVFQYAKELISKEGGEPCIVLCAALLLAAVTHTPGTVEDQHRRFEGLPEANTKVREALLHLKLDQDITNKVCHILENGRRDTDSETVEFQIVCDSLALAELAVGHFRGNFGEWEKLVATRLRTESAKNKALALFKA